VKRTTARWSAAGIGLLAGAYGACVALAWARYGRPASPSPDERDELLDAFMPACDVAERHHIAVAAPAPTTLAAAAEMDLRGSPLARLVFRGRELILGAAPDKGPRPRGLLAETQALGWGVLAESPGREIVMGAATRPWEPNPTFRTLLPDEFAPFREPGYVKIAWSLRADPLEHGHSIFRTETRAVATDSRAASRFRRYWAFLSPGIILIRLAMLPALKRDAERRARRITP
jgi:hypothetical protein